MGVKTVRVGSEDSSYLNAVAQADINAPLVARAVRTLRVMDREPMTPGEVGEFFGIGR